MKGRFITLEGGEGAGKSSCMAAAVAVLEARGIEVVQSREPGGTPLSETLRDLVLDPAMGEIDPRAELLMVFAARAQHLSEKIRPALQRGQWVVCDRFTDASFAYQGGGRGLPEDEIRWLEQWTHGDLQPDRTLLLDLPPEVGLARATGNREADRLEIEEVAFYQRVRAAYQRRAEGDPDRFRIIDANRPLEEVIRSVENAITRFVEDHE